MSPFSPVPLTPEAQQLPDIHGSGRVRNLREATSLSGDLTNALTTYANATTRAEQIGQLDNLLLKWSQTSDMPDVVLRGVNNFFCKMQTIRYIPTPLPLAA